MADAVDRKKREKGTARGRKSSRCTLTPVQNAPVPTSCCTKTHPTTSHCTQKHLLLFFSKISLIFRGLVIGFEGDAVVAFFRFPFLHQLHLLFLRHFAPHRTHDLACKLERYCESETGIERGIKRNTTSYHFPTSCVHARYQGEGRSGK